MDFVRESLTVAWCKWGKFETRGSDREALYQSTWCPPRG
jgi:hypothetical protein